MMLPGVLYFGMFLYSLTRDRVRKLVVGFVYLPHFISWVVVVGLFVQVLGPSGMVYSRLTDDSHHVVLDVFRDPSWFKPMMLIELVWKDCGWGTIIFLAALYQVDDALYEAAALDGAGWARRTWHVTLPSIRPVLVLLLILRVGDILSVGFDQVMQQRDTFTPAAATYTPAQGLHPDLPGTAAGVQDTFLRYPSNLVQAVPTKPGDGSKVRALIVTYGTQPKGPDQNQLWKAVNDTAGVDIELTMVADSDWQTKLGAMMAGSDLPDIIMLGLYQLPNEAQFLQAYPNLAAIPHYSWDSVGRVGGDYYGIPIHRPRLGNSQALSQQITDGINQIVTGKASLASWDDVMKKWKSSGGDQIAAELGTAYAKTHG